MMRLVVCCIVFGGGIALAADRPEPREVPFEQLRLIRSPSIGLKHYSVGGLDLPLNGMIVDVDCGIDPQFGLTKDCNVSSEVPDAVKRAAIRQANAYGFDTDDLAAGNGKSEARTHVPIHLDPKDRLALDDSTAKTVPLSDMVIDFSHVDLDYIYPEQERNAGIEGTATGHCQVQSDLSVVCIKIVADPPNEAGFTAAFEKSALRLRVARQLKSGKPAAGSWFSYRLKFSLPH